MKILFPSFLSVAFFTLVSGAMAYYFDIDRSSMWYLLPFAVSALLLFITYEYQSYKVVNCKIDFDNIQVILGCSLLNAINVFGLLLYIPILLAAGMLLGSPSWTIWLIVTGSVSLGPLCLVAALSKKWKFMGIVGFGFITISVLINTVIYGG